MGETCFKMIQTSEEPTNQSQKGKNKYQKKQTFYNLEKLEKTPDLLIALQNDVRGEDNRDLLDDGKSQALTDDDIEVLKSEGLSSTQLIETIVENSKTYSQKTQF